MHVWCCTLNCSVVKVQSHFCLRHLSGQFSYFHSHVNTGALKEYRHVMMCNKSRVLWHVMAKTTTKKPTPGLVLLHISRTRVLRMAAVTSELYEMESVVRGHHIYKAVWTPVIGEELLPSTSCSFWLHHLRALLASTVKCLAASLLRVLDCLSFKVTLYALRFDISRSVLTGTQN